MKSSLLKKRILVLIMVALMVCGVAPEVFSTEASSVQNEEASLQDALEAVRVDLTGSVSLTGKDLTPGMFSFTLKDVTDRNNIKSIATVKNDKEGKFSVILPFYEDGVFCFEMMQDPVTIAGVTLDTHVYPFKVVTEKNTEGKLTYKVLDDNNKQMDVESSSVFRFTNQFKSNTNTLFVDVHQSDYFFNPVKWALQNLITTGTSLTTFSPDDNCSRAQIVTFLWRAKGNPEPANRNNPFIDVRIDAYYYKAVLWAAEQGVTTGTTATTFSPDMTVTRAQTVTFLWRAEGSPAARADNPFGDVQIGQYYTNAVLWAVKNQITTGKTSTLFSPGDACIRAQIVTFLYRVNRQINSRSIIDARGEYVKIPENVTSIACSGQSAVLFCAVGGEQIIKASSEDYVSNPLLDYNASSQIQSLWRGNGTGTITEADFAALMSLQPEVLVELSGTSSFNSDQIAQLQAKGTSYVVLPALDSLENIKKAVGLAGQMTGDRSRFGGVNGEALASQYSKYVDNLINNTQSRVRSAGSGSGFCDLGISSDGYYNGKYSLYIQGWDDSASYSISNSNFSGTGVAWSGNNQSSVSRLMTSLMSIGGVYNTVQKMEQTSVKNLYIVPLSWWQSSMTLEVNGFQISSEGNNGHIARKKLLEHQNQMLGSEVFPAVIAGNRNVADNLPPSPLWQPGSEVPFDGNFQVNGFLSSDGSTGIASSIIRSFPVYVSPSGLGSWTEGSPESVLESAWVASMFYGAYSDEELKELIKEFYSIFYRINLKDSQVSTILAGSEY